MKIAPLPEHIYNPIMAMGFSAMFTFQLQTTLKYKHCGIPFLLGVIDPFGHYGLH